MLGQFFNLALNETEKRGKNQRKKMKNQTKSVKNRNLNVYRVSTQQRVVHTKTKLRFVYFLVRFTQAKKHMC